MRRVLEIVIAVILLVAAVVCWNFALTDTVFVEEGVPDFTSRRLSGPWIGAATLCSVGAALMIVDAVRLSIAGRREWSLQERPD